MLLICVLGSNMVYIHNRNNVLFGYSILLKSNSVCQADFTAENALFSLKFKGDDDKTLTVGNFF